MCVTCSEVLIACLVLCSSTTVTSTEMTPENNITQITEMIQIYYDMNGQPVPPISNHTDVMPALKLGVLRYGWLPCSCQSLTCGCCANININMFNFQRKGCMNFTYDPDEFALNMDMLMNDKSIYHNSISGKNPPPACLPVTPTPFLPGMEFCIRFYDVYTPGQNFHACVNFETKLAKVPLLILQFDCFRMGADGFAVVKPNAANAGLSNTSTMLPIEDVDPLPELNTEVYDEVTEEKKLNEISLLSEEKHNKTS
ncbi:uncharacterized protein LOC142321126 [Lycorma delicatula]|uniref:uncharacterized protein LOC142321126 n=1 Tax=Lycorma delicatula TaxID=130591 RepID=UPI003F516619